MTTPTSLDRLLRQKRTLLLQGPIGWFFFRLARAVISPVLNDQCFLHLASMAQSILEQNLRPDDVRAQKLVSGCNAAIHV